MSRARDRQERAELTWLPTANTSYGAWGTAALEGYDVAMVWRTLSTWLIASEGIAPSEARRLLDSRFGRHLVDDLSYASNGRPLRELSEAAIVAHLAARFAKPGWRSWLSSARVEARAAS